MTPKEKAISKLKTEFNNKDWLELDRYEIDYHNFIIEKIASHLSIKGIKILTKEYADWNKEGKEQIEKFRHHKF